MTNKDTERYTKMVEAGNEIAATNQFYKKYILPSVESYRQKVSNLMRKAEDGIMTANEMNSLSIKISAETTGLRSKMVSQFKEFIDKVSAKNIFKKLGITDPRVKRAIKSQTLALFKERTAGALSQTNTRMLSSVRKYQKDLTVETIRLDRLQETVDDFTAQARKRADKLVKSRIRKMNPDFIKQVDEGKFIVYRDGSKHKIEDYSQMATETTVLNVDRVANEVTAITSGKRIVEYYQISHRSLQTKARKICKRILSRKFYGKSILAVDQETADLLGIMTIEQAKTTPDYAMGIHCRHGIKQVSAAYNQRIENALFVSKTGEKLSPGGTGPKIPKKLPPKKLAPGELDPRGIARDFDPKTQTILNPMTNNRIKITSVSKSYIDKYLPHLQKKNKKYEVKE